MLTIKMRCAEVTNSVRANLIAVPRPSGFDLRISLHA